MEEERRGEGSSDDLKNRRSKKTKAPRTSRATLVTKEEPQHLVLEDNSPGATSPNLYVSNGCQSEDMYSSFIDCSAIQRLCICELNDGEGSESEVPDPVVCECKDSLSRRLVAWAAKHNISQRAFAELLEIIKDADGNLPESASGRAPEHRRATTSDTPEEIACSVCGRSFRSKIGFGVHMRSMHPAEREAEAARLATKVRWTAEERLFLAAQEAAAVRASVRFPNQHLVQLVPGRTIESIKGVRRRASYKATVQRFLAPPSPSSCTTGLLHQ